MSYYNKNQLVIKDKIPPITKKGANGINFWCLIYAHAPPNMHASTNAVASPIGPIHNPPTAIIFMSPMPIGASAPGLRRDKNLSKIKPTVAAIMYPNVIPVTAVSMPHTHGKNVVMIAPIINSGNRYASGIIRRRISVCAIFHDKNNAIANKSMKKAQNKYKNIHFPLAFRFGFMIQ